MKEIVILNEKKIVYQIVEYPYIWEERPFGGQDFVCLLVINENVSNDLQSEISNKLVAFGCKYAVCTGVNCSSWDDSFDMAYLESCEYNFIEENIVMTSWHENEPIEDAVFFFINNTNFDNHDFKNYLVLFIGKDDNKREEIEILITEEVRKGGI